jgi:hypothetical protein
MMATVQMCSAPQHGVPGAYRARCSASISFLLIAYRAVYTRKVEGQSDPVHFYDPTALAIAGLCAACSDCEPLFYDFLVALGIPALVEVLAESKCPVTLTYTVDFIAMLEAEIIAPGTPEFCQDFAENYLMGRAPPQKPPCYQELHDAFFDIGGWFILMLDVDNDDNKDDNTFPVRGLGGCVCDVETEDMYSCMGAILPNHFSSAGARILLRTPAILAHPVFVHPLSPC